MSKTKHIWIPFGKQPVQQSTRLCTGAQTDCQRLSGEPEYIGRLMQIRHDVENIKLNFVQIRVQMKNTIAQILSTDHSHRIILPR